MSEIFSACVDDGVAESKAFHLDHVCSVLEMALSVSMARGTLKDNQKILVVSCTLVHLSHRWRNG